MAMARLLLWLRLRPEADLPDSQLDFECNLTLLGQIRFELKLDQINSQVRPLGTQYVRWRDD